MEQLFKDLASEEQGTYEATYQDAYTHLFLNFPFSKRYNGRIIRSLRLQIPYQGARIEVVYKIADNHVAKLSCKFPKGTALAPFRIEKNNPIWRLFRRDTKTLTIECDDPVVKNFLFQELSGLETIAQQGQFEPVIEGRQQEDHYHFTANYHLSFAQKEEVLRPLIRYCKALVDFAQRNQVQGLPSVRRKSGSVQSD